MRREQKRFPCVGDACDNVMKRKIHLSLATKIKLIFSGMMGMVILSLWFFGGILGALTGIVKDEALYAVLSLLVPAFGAIYTLVSAVGALF